LGTFLTIAVVVILCVGFLGYVGGTFGESRQTVADRAARPPPLRPAQSAGQRIELIGPRSKDFYMVPKESGFDLYRQGSGMVKWISLRPDDPVWAFGITGVQFQPDGHELMSSEAFAPGARVTFEREPDNPADPNAVAILDALGDRQVGYVPRAWADDVADRLDDGEALDAWVVWEKRKAGHRIGAWVMVLADGITVNWP